MADTHYFADIRFADLAADTVMVDTETPIVAATAPANADTQYFADIPCGEMAADGTNVPEAVVVDSSAVLDEGVTVTVDDDADEDDEIPAVSVSASEESTVSLADAALDDGVGDDIYNDGSNMMEEAGNDAAMEEGALSDPEEPEEGYPSNPWGLQKIQPNSLTHICREWLEMVPFWQTEKFNNSIDDHWETRKLLLKYCWKRLSRKDKQKYMKDNLNGGGINHKQFRKRVTRATYQARKSF